MKLNSHIPITVDIGEEEPLALGAKRLSYEESTKLRAKWKEALNAQDAQRDELMGAIYVDSFKRYVRLDCELIIECADGEIRVRKPDELLEFFGGRPAVLDEIFYSIILQNGLSDEKKRLLQLATAFKLSSEGQRKDQAGPKPETTATSAESETSADNGDATSEASDPSGSTDHPETPSSPTSVRSVH